ncbi:SPASM domain-containing protein [Desulfurivibrio alkaliphilus]|uniref:Radical SAM domain protein n=1 Tax=Desulfurivibrio alkaliphilus (strain DSM 19089 / UNIQEM U267 / AHT2) TaxID=589865 RepID=D6Z042_DESAT|nr:SPASM domain-containing protein [Desulfurivibrio alkaliphilus]ADH87075.1 Radical SAM domain protein [Desulfurivibrio alkaliphilus AHT 2]
MAAEAGSRGGHRRYSPFRHLGSVLYKKDPLHLTIFLTRRCNQRCSFCFYLAADTSPAAAKAMELSLPELEQIAASSPPLLWLAFSGGEIFLRDDLAAITASFYRHTRPAIILLPSNGLDTPRITAAVSDILRRCPRSTVVVKLSLDGPPAVHDALRGVPGSHAACLRTAAELGKLQGQWPNFELGINSVFCPATQESMRETVDFVAGLPHINTHTISLARGDLADKSQLAADLEKYHQACEYLAQKLKKRQAATYRFGGARLKAAQDILQRRYILATARQGQAQLPCYAGRLNLVIADDGTVYPCEDFRSAMAMGNIRDFDGKLKNLLASPRAREVVAAIRRHGCFCTHECYMMTNILFNPVTWPSLLKEYLQLR